jgi:hypothetical protein
MTAAGHVHLMIPNFLPGGSAEYACNLDGTHDPGVVPMRQRTLNPGEATCTGCLAAAAAGLPRRGVLTRGKAADGSAVRRG